ncbi:hypothetical protein Y032_0022g542 [Ancylostoma ceylanicum]|uniref:Uncharacterized protein n=1 Tax=Ancylostoma ceylanicum TaxID=53326 RepID=A0A016UZP7_9BILA|nr:hypothetical protein Y032_0022g542 [Ancylostoma ceylanicum]
MSNNHLNVENFHATAAVPGPSLANRPPALVIPGICEPNKRYDATRKMLKAKPVDRIKISIFGSFFYDDDIECPQPPCHRLPFGFNRGSNVAQVNKYINGVHREIFATGRTAQRWMLTLQRAILASMLPLARDIPFVRHIGSYPAKVAPHVRKNQC